MKQPQEDTKERQETYKNAETAHLLIKIIEANNNLNPTYDTTRGYHYPEIETLLNKDSTSTEKTLQKLATIGILNQKTIDMVLHCPECNSANISTTYICPSCNSPQIIRNALIEHITCGYINTLPYFKVEDNLICPKCKSPLKRTDVRSAGRWYECANCKKRIENPQPLHTCRNCQEKFDFNEAKYTEAYNYTLSDTAKTEINNGALFPFLVEKRLTNLNHQVQVPGKITGASGIQHEFDAIIKTNDGKQIAIDALFANQPVNRLQITMEHEKISDTKIEAYIIASAFNEEAKKLIQFYKLNTIEASPAIALNELISRIQPEKTKQSKKEKTQDIIEQFTTQPNTPQKEPEKKTPKLGGLFKKNKQANKP
ncbi:MAG: hypothetical protein N3D85_05010 [Candidatus Bathyarchaeota archaeon]|nr:hypothetical protein [Candidatus Bathyarchaeota archaeon]